MRSTTLKTQALALSFVAALSAGCTWVKPVEGSDQVRLLKASELAACKKLGHTTSFVKHEIAGIARNPKTVSEELVTLGKNQAAQMGGDAIVQATDFKEGKVGFDIYKCP